MSPVWLVICILAAATLVQLVLLARLAATALFKYFWMRELDLAARYGSRSWVSITGASAGQGRAFALQFARRGFNLVLIGSSRVERVRAEIEAMGLHTHVLCVVKDFRRSFEPGFFDDIERVLRSVDLSVLVNNVGHRVGWRPYHEMDPGKIADVIAVGAITQARMTHIVAPMFLARTRLTSLRCALVNITAQCMHPNILPGVGDNAISVPYLSVYEATNAFGFYHSGSIYKEYGAAFDVLTITPGAVVTENTPFLHGTVFAVPCEVFVANVLRMLGNVQGATYAHWGHAFSAYIITLIPGAKDRILRDVGENIARDYMERWKQQRGAIY
jgi:17beta-estradiol 17-dehydrogenase / very-long-chain 3-oxoacyl-CoA reductase